MFEAAAARVYKYSTKRVQHGEEQSNCGWWMVDEGGGGGGEDRQVPLNCFYCITRISVLKPEWWQFYDLQIVD